MYVKFNVKGRKNNMTKLLTINGKSYKAAPFDLNLICDFEDNGISFDAIEGKMFNVIRLYVAISVGVDVRKAGLMLSEHLENGGSLEEIASVMSEMMEDSGFFRGKQESEETSNQPRTRKKKSAEE